MLTTLNKMRKNQKGFSLVELMVVVAIIGILAAVAIPNFQRFQRKAKQSEAKAALGGISSAESAFFAQWEEYSTDLIGIGYVPDGTLIYSSGFSQTKAWGFSPVATGPADYTGAVLVGGRNNTMQPTVCLAGMCSFMGTVANPSASVAPVNRGNTAAYTISADGALGGAANDVWTMNQAKDLNNLTDGTI